MLDDPRSSWGTGPCSSPVNWKKMRRRKRTLEEERVWSRDGNSYGGRERLDLDTSTKSPTSREEGAWITEERTSLLFTGSLFSNTPMAATRSPLNTAIRRTEALPRRDREKKVCKASNGDEKESTKSCLNHYGKGDARKGKHLAQVFVTE